MSFDRGRSIPRVVGSDGRALVPPIHPRHAYVDPQTGYRNLDVEMSVTERADGAIVYDDIHDRDPTAVAVELTAEAVEWLLSELPPGDRFTRVLDYARNLAKEKAWERAANQAAEES